MANRITVGRGLRVAAFATAMIVFIAWNDAEGKPLGSVRICPACQEPTVIGHGWRSRPADDACHRSIRIHRGRCKTVPSNGHNAAAVADPWRPA